LSDNNFVERDLSDQIILNLFLQITI